MSGPQKTAQRNSSPETTSPGSLLFSNLKLDQRLQPTLWTTPRKESRVPGDPVDRQTGSLKKTIDRYDVGGRGPARMLPGIMKGALLSTQSL